MLYESSHRPLLFVAMILGAGCTGASTEGAPDNQVDTSAADLSACSGPSGPRTRLERLTHRQYANTLRDLIGQKVDVGRDLSPDPGSSRFDNEAQLLVVGGPLSRDYRRIAEQVGGEVANNPERAARLAGCSEASAACIESFVSSFGARAFRRPLSGPEQAAFVNLFRSGEAQGSFAGGVGLVLEAMLQSPEFLYRVALNDQPGSEGLAALSALEVASQLSYSLWNSMPDPELFATAEDNSLLKPEVLRKQINRMLADERARDVVSDFHAQYMQSNRIRELQRDQKRYPAFSTGMVPGMKREVELFASAAVLDENMAFKGFMTAPFTFVNSSLAKLYGVQAPKTSDTETFTRVDLDPSQRAGLLTQIGFLASHAHSDASAPILRGTFVLKQVLCQDLPPPPADVDLTLPTADPGMSTRELVNRITSPSACVGCHNAINPAGFGLENFDAVGQWRVSDAGKPINAQGQLMLDSGEVAFDGPVQLSVAVANSPEAQACYAQSWVSYLLARQTSEDMRCMAQALAKASRDKQLTIKEMLAEVVASRGFLYRPITNGEGVTP